MSGAMKVEGEGEGPGVGWVDKEMQSAQELRGVAHKYSRRRRRRLQRRSEGVTGAVELEGESEGGGRGAG